MILLCVAIVAILIIIYCCSKNSREGYRDPIYLNRAKFAYDWYPKSNGSIYGFYEPYGSWNLFSGYVLYNNAY